MAAAARSMVRKIYQAVAPSLQLVVPTTGSPFLRRRWPNVFLKA